MAANAANREAARDALAALLEAELVGDGKPVEVVYNHLKGDFEGQTPVVMVISDGTRRKQHGIGSGRWDSHFRLMALVFVADACEEEGWTDEDVEDTLDWIGKELADVIADNRNTGDWSYLDLADEFTTVSAISVGGKPYVMEAHAVIARVIDA